MKDSSEKGGRFLYCICLCSINLGIGQHHIRPALIHLVSYVCKSRCWVLGLRIHDSEI